MTLKDWLDEIGHVDAARIFKVDISTVRSWRVGRTKPRALELKRLVKYSKGAVTYEQVNEDYLRAQATFSKAK